VMFNSLSN